MWHWYECQTAGRFWDIESQLFNLVMSWGRFAFYAHALILRSNIFSTLFFFFFFGADIPLHP